MLAMSVGMALTPDGDALYVNNGNRHDLATIRTAGDAKAEAKTLKLIAKDPLSQEVRLGKTVFMSANSDEYPVTQQHWMSCASCHASGETDGLTLMAGKGPRNVPSNVGAMETGLLLWDGSRGDLTDYIHTVQDAMGGMSGTGRRQAHGCEAAKAVRRLGRLHEGSGQHAGAAQPVPRGRRRSHDRGAGGQGAVRDGGAVHRVPRRRVFHG